MSDITRVGGRSLDRAVPGGKLAAGDRDAALGHLSSTTALADLAEVVPSVLTSSETVERGRSSPGHATAENIDTGMMLGCAHPVGPLKLADLIGLDTLKAIAGALYAKYKEPLYAAPLLRMTAAGLLGRKSGRGFCEY